MRMRMRRLMTLWLMVGIVGSLRNDCNSGFHLELETAACRFYTEIEQGITDLDLYVQDLSHVGRVELAQTVVGFSGQVRTLSTAQMTDSKPIKSNKQDENQDFTGKWYRTTTSNHDRNEVSGPGCQERHTRKSKRQHVMNKTIYPPTPNGG